MSKTIEYKGRKFTVRSVKNADYVAVRINGRLLSYCEDVSRAQLYIHRLVDTLG